METFLAIIRVVWAIVLTMFIVMMLYILAAWCKQDVETHAKVDAIYKHLGLDTIPSDTINIGRGDTINFNIKFKQ